MIGSRLKSELVQASAANDGVGMEALLDFARARLAKSCLRSVSGHKLMQTLPTVLVPGLGTDSRLYAKQIPALWQFGPVMIANQTRKDSMTGIAQEILSYAPPRFALAGLSMGATWLLR